MDKRAVAKARVRFRGADEAFRSLQHAPDYPTFQHRWYSFLSAWKGIYTTLCEGARAPTTSWDWFKAKTDEKNGDQLLKYLYAARNDDEHGLQDPTKYIPGGIGIGSPKPGASNDFIMTGSWPGGMTIRPLDGKPVFVEVVQGRAILVAVEDDKHRIIQPPREHLGKLLADPTPLVVAENGLQYVAKMIDEAAAIATA